MLENTCTWETTCNCDLMNPGTPLWEVGQHTGTINHANKNMVTRTCDTGRPKICPNDTLDNITNHSFRSFPPPASVLVAAAKTH